MRILITIVFGLAYAFPVWAQVEQHFQQTLSSIQSRIKDGFKCQEIKNESRLLICQTNFNFPDGLVPLQIRVRETYTEGIRYEFKIFREPTRQEIYPYIMTIVEYFDPLFAHSFNQDQSKRSDFFEGGLVYTANGITYEVDDGNSVTILNVTKENPTKTLNPFNYYADPNCGRKNNIKGWEATWGDDWSAIQPVFKNVVVDQRVEGRFHFTANGIHAAFQALPIDSYLRTKGYITIFVDKRAVYQGKWETSSVLPYIPNKNFGLWGNGNEGLLTISRDSKAKNIIAAATFDITNLKAAMNMALTGQSTQAKLKKLRKCK